MASRFAASYHLYLTEFAEGRRKHLESDLIENYPMSDSIPPDALSDENNRFLDSNKSPAEILESFRSYLLMVANRETNPKLKLKVSPSDFVQMTLILANHDFPEFRGTTERELLGWLKTILFRQIASAARTPNINGNHVPLQDSENGYFEDIEDKKQKTPSSHLSAEEEARRLHQAIAKLDQVDQIIIRMRNWEKKTFEQIGNVIGMAESGARKRWIGAIGQLQRLLKNVT